MEDFFVFGVILISLNVYTRTVNFYDNRTLLWVWGDTNFVRDRSRGSDGNRI